MAPPTGPWRRAVVRAITRPHPGAVALRLEVDERIEHEAGQHYVMRLTAEDGYTASRSYSVASAPGDPLLELYVERLPDGEVSTFLADVLEIGDEVEVRGPIGGWFVWDGSTTAVGIGGGSGVVPLISMLRHAHALGHPERLRIAVSARTRATLPYADELEAAGATIALTRENQPGRRAARLTAEEVTRLVKSVGLVGGAGLADGGGEFFVCGSTHFTESASDLLLDAHVAPGLIRVERFGPSA